MADRRRILHTVAAILRMRRRAEAEAHGGFETARAQLLRGRLAEAKARGKELQAEQALSRVRGRHDGTIGKEMPAQALQQIGDAALRQVQLLHHHGAIREREGERVAQLSQQVEQQRERWLLSIARREAAELYEARERRGWSRGRAQKKEALEEEVAAGRLLRLRGVPQ